jgi:hypothetical protein
VPKYDNHRVVHVERKKHEPINPTPSYWFGYGGTALLALIGFIILKGVLGCA